jgi:hypothetical protein
MFNGKNRITMRLKITMLAAIMCVWSANVQAAELYAQALDHQRMNDITEHITQEMRTNGTIRFATKAVAGCGALTALYLYLADFKIVQGDEIRLLRNGYAKFDLAYKALENLGLLADLSQADKDLAITASSGGGWGSFLCRQLGFMTLSLGVSKLFEKCMTQIFYKKRISWFVQNRTLLPSLHKQLDVLKVDLDNLSKGVTLVSQEACDAYVQTIVEVHNNLVAQFEQIIGYVRYCIAALDEDNKKAASGVTIETYLNGRAGFVAKYINKELAAYKELDDRDKQVLSIRSMFDAIYQMMLQANSAIEQFAIKEIKF